MRFVLQMLGVLLLVGCSSHRASSQAILSRKSDGQFEIQLLSVDWVAGGPCNFPQWPHRVFSKYWIYSDTTNGSVTADHVTITYGGDLDDFRATQEGPLHGSVSFTGNRVQVALLLPAFPDGTHLAYYKGFKLNGDYDLRVK
jgi:hypothetical protein